MLNWLFTDISVWKGLKSCTSCIDLFSWILYIILSSELVETKLSVCAGPETQLVSGGSDNNVIVWEKQDGKVCVYNNNKYLCWQHNWVVSVLCNTLDKMLNKSTAIKNWFVFNINIKGNFIQDFISLSTWVFFNIHFHFFWISFE